MEFTVHNHQLSCITFRSMYIGIKMTNVHHLDIVGPDNAGYLFSWWPDWLCRRSWHHALNAVDSVCLLNSRPVSGERRLAQCSLVNSDLWPRWLADDGESGSSPAAFTRSSDCSLPRRRHYPEAADSPPPAQPPGPVRPSATPGITAAPSPGVGACPSQGRPLLV